MNLLIFCFLVVAVTAGPLIHPSDVKILKYDNYNDGTGGFKYEVEQSDGSKSQARGNLVKVVAEGKEVDVLVIEGSYSYVIDGRTYTVRYVADQNGYHPNIVVQEPSRPTLSTLLFDDGAAKVPFPPPPLPPPPLSKNELILRSLLGGSSGSLSTLLFDDGAAKVPFPPPPLPPPPLSKNELILRSLLGGSSGSVKRTREVALDSFFLIMDYIQEDMKKYQ